MVRSWSFPWLMYIKVKHHLFGLMPLQGLVNKYHALEPEREPLWTYWLLLTYEAEVLEALKKVCASASTNEENKEQRIAEAEKNAYLQISSALRDPQNPANHNINKKVFLHLLGLVVISFLMVGIAASNTMSLIGFLSDNGVAFGAYTNLFIGSIYISSLWAQWMIFRRGVTKMLKSLFSWSNDGLDFFETAELELAPNESGSYVLRLKQEDKGNIADSDLPGYSSRRWRSLFYGVCTASCAMVWGVVVYSKLSDGLHSADGFFGFNGAFAESWGLVFGSLAGFAACFLWLTSLRTDMKAEEREERRKILNNIVEDDNEKKKSLLQKIQDQPAMLTVLLATTLYALLASMLGQGRIVFEALGWENQNGNPLDPRHPLGFAYFLVFLTAIFIGRMRFSMNAMVTFYENAKSTVEASTVEKLKTEIETYRSNYIMGCCIALVLVGFFAASLQYDVLRKPMSEGSNGHRIFSPMGIMALGAIFVWTLFLILKRYKDGTPEQADLKDVDREEKTAWFPSGFVPKGSCIAATLTSRVRKGYEDRTGNACVAAVLNGAAFGGIGGKGIEGSVEDIAEAATHDENKDPAWVKPAAAGCAVPGQVTLGLQSFTTSTQPRGLIPKEITRSETSSSLFVTG